MTTEEKLARLEERVETVEQLVGKAFSLYEQFLDGAGRKVAKLLGVELPRAR